MKDSLIKARLTALLKAAYNTDNQDENSPDYMSDGMMLDVFIEEIEKILK
tara:strand:+ start:1700 stop:1849 length:150 start_codon:yes stop_codon:yes gene_type:complete